MKPLNLKFTSILAIASLSSMACTNHDFAAAEHNAVGVAVAASSIPNNTSTNAGPTNSVSGGSNPVGVTVPTGSGIVARIQNGLENKVQQTTGNFAKALAQASPNLPTSPNVNLATGYDQVELVAYGACADLTTGGNPLMQTVYNVAPSATIATNQAALVAAGIRMLDQHVAGLASQGPTAAQINTVFTTLVQNEAAVATNTSTIAFMAVCMAANTAGATMLGF